MNNFDKDIASITYISDGIYLSGILPLNDEMHEIKKLGIKYILCCVDRQYVKEIHDKIMMENPHLVVLYLPYFDDIFQNLWKDNKNLINITRYSTNMDQYNDLIVQLQKYNNKPLIEIGYHFIDNAVKNNQKILVHCMAGISRSVSLVIYYFMKKYHMSYNEAYALVLKNRSIANPNDSFIQQLKLYDILRDKFNKKNADDIISNVQKNKTIQKNHQLIMSIKK